MHKEEELLLGGSDTRKDKSLSPVKMIGAREVYSSNDARAWQSKPPHSSSSSPQGPGQRQKFNCE